MRGSRPASEPRRWASSSGLEAAGSSSRWPPVTSCESLPASVTPVGVFVNQPAEHVNAVAQALGLGAVQLHGPETPEYCARITAPVIKAVPVGSGFRMTAVADLPAARDGAARCRRSGGSRWNRPSGRLDGRAGGGTRAADDSGRRSDTGERGCRRSAPSNPMASTCRPVSNPIRASRTTVASGDSSTRSDSAAAEGRG